MSGDFRGGCVGNIFAPNSGARLSEGQRRSGARIRGRISAKGPPGREVATSMANNVALVDEATNAIGGIAVADRAPIAADWIPALRDAGEVSTRTIRPHLHHLPEQASDVASPADCEPAVSALGRITVGRGPIADITVDSDTGQVFVTNQVDHSVSMLDPGTLTVIGAVTGVEEPSAVTSAA